MLKKSGLIGICLIFLFLAVVFAFMKNGGKKVTIVEAENEIPSETPFETKKNKGPLPKLESARIVVKKAARKLEVFDGDRLVRTYRIGLGFAPEGDKETEGDGKTPEGEFYIFTKNERSRYYLSLGVSYPSADDAERGFRENLISQNERDQIVEAIKNKKMPLQSTALGGEIYIHGNGSKSDWTLGCVALEDEEIKQLFDAIPVGTSVRIEP